MRFQRWSLGTDEPLPAGAARGARRGHRRHGAGPARGGRRAPWTSTASIPTSRPRRDAPVRRGRARHLGRAARAPCATPLLSTVAAGLLILLVLLRAAAAHRARARSTTLTHHAVEIGRTRRLPDKRLGLAAHGRDRHPVARVRRRCWRSWRARAQAVVETARAAGMSEIATGVLHNVGNVLNSVNVSADAGRRARPRRSRLTKLRAPGRDGRASTASDLGALHRQRTPRASTSGRCLTELASS